MSKPFGTYDYVPRVRKVKHVKFLFHSCLEDLENEINKYADDHPEYKILGIKLMEDSNRMFIATITYLEDAKNGQMVYDGDDDGSDEERDSD